ncbi:MAG: histidinol-phosphatase [Nitrospiraceae bacterium]|nr:histidinol-phosphatase [Nitrospiraceae bacterium]
MQANNQRLAALFRSMAELLASQRANPYRVRAYRRAADTLLQLDEDVGAVALRGSLEELDGIGKELADKITEFLQTGTVRAYEQLKRPLPAEINNWTKLPGLSESLVAYLYFRLGIQTAADLEQLVQSHLLRTMPGFTGSEDVLLEAIRRQSSQRPLD